MCAICKHINSYKLSVIYKTLVYCLQKVAT